VFNGFQNVGAQLLGIVGLEWDLLGVRDFNGDGRADLLFRRASDGMLSLYLMNGFQIIDAQLLGAVGLDQTLFGLGDVNGDGRSDMVFRRNSDGLVSIYLMNGFQLLAAQSIGAIGTDMVGCFGQPPLSVALTTAGGGSTP
jgi:sRNA-binding regulator protein Hfq